MAVSEIMREQFLSMTIYTRRLERRKWDDFQIVLGQQFDSFLSIFHFQGDYIAIYDRKYIPVAFLFEWRKEDTFLIAATNSFTFLMLEAIIF